MHTRFKSVLLAALALSLLLSTPSIAEAQEETVVIKNKGSYASAGDFGLGLVLGSPTGITGKFYLAPSAAIDATVGIGLGEDLHVHADYLFEGGDLAGQPGFRLGWFVGIGGRLVAHDDEDVRHSHGNQGTHTHDRDELDFGPRVPVGLEFRPAELRQLEVFAEVALGVDLVDDPGLTIDAGLGVRYFF